MVEDIKYSSSAPKSTQSAKKSADSEFQKFLKETTNEGAKEAFHADFKQGQEVQKASAKKEAKKIQNDEADTLIADNSKLSKLDAKEQITQSVANAKDSKPTNLASALQGSSTANLVQNTSLKDAQNLAQNTQGAQNLNSEKTLADVKNLANQKGLNVQSASIQSGIGDEVISESVITQAPKPRAPREIPESAKQKIQYEVESKDERVAIINRGVKKPRDITSKISNVYEEGKAEKSASTSTLGSLLGLKDLP